MSVEKNVNKLVYLFVLLLSTNSCQRYNIPQKKCNIISELQNSNIENTTPKYRGTYIIIKNDNELIIGKYKCGKKNGFFNYYNSNGFLYISKLYKKDSLVYIRHYLPKI